MCSRIVFIGRRQAILQKVRLPTLGQNNLLLRSRVSLISTGTELTAFGHCFEHGTHWDAWVKYPFQPGYATVARIEQIGKNIRGAKIGDRVVTRVPHASHHMVKETQITFVPDAVSDEEAAWFALAKIAFAGILAANLQVGARVVVVGAGPVGQMVVRWAAISAVAEIVVIDRNEKRLALARRGGATGTIARALSDEIDTVIANLGGRRPEVIFDCTGNPSVLAHALRLVADHGKIIILGDTGFPAAQCLTSDVVWRGISIIGAHDLHTRSSWGDEREIFHLFFRFLSRGRFSTAHLVTHKFDPRRAQQAYLLAEKRKGDTGGILFDWSRMK
jgi:2-desacetyl-2-hydroxyethyl bacteriochlorophyllide A dehydrogenase